MLPQKLLEHQQAENANQGRECEGQGRRECDPPESFCGPGASRTGNARWFAKENRNRRASSGGILGIGTPREHRRSCRPSSMWMIHRERRGSLWRKAETLTRIGAVTESESCLPNEVRNWKVVNDDIDIHCSAPKTLSTLREV